MKIRKIYLFVLFIAVFVFLYSCQSRLNPRYLYNSKSSSDNGNSGGGDLPDDIPEDPSDTNAGGGETNEDGTITVYLDPFVHGEWNKPDYRFNMNFDDMQIRASFDGDNRPSYNLVRGNWNLANASENSYYYDGPNTSGAGQSISSVQYYLYKSKNPLFAVDSRYNKSDKLKRFYFYRFNGKALGMVYTDNFLVAIDTYSKLVFAYAVPVEWKQYIAGTPKAPISWGSVDAGWETDYNGGGKVNFKVSGASYFYEYDPIGIVKQNGEIEIYKWCSDSIGNNKRYGPRIDGGNARDLSRPIATYGIPGRSPYIPIKTNVGKDYTNGIIGGDDYGETTKDIITITAKSFKNIKAWTWHYGVYLFHDLKRSVGFYHFRIGGAVYDGNFPTEVDYIENMKELGGISDYKSDLVYLDWNQEKKFAKSKSYEIEDIKRDKDVYIDLASDIGKYNLTMTYADTAGFGNNHSGWVANKDSQKTRLIYDPDKDAFVMYSIKDANGFSHMTIADPNFTLKRGEKKDFTIKYTWKGLTGYDESAELTYTLEFKSSVEGKRVNLKDYKF